MEYQISNNYINCKRENILCGGNFRIFHDITFFVKFSPVQKLNSYDLEKYRENYSHVKCLANIFAKLSPSENNHVYTIWEI